MSESATMQRCDCCRYCRQHAEEPVEDAYQAIECLGVGWKISADPSSSGADPYSGDSVRINGRLLLFDAEKHARDFARALSTARRDREKA
jgi:hypothetical protein